MTGPRILCNGNGVLPHLQMGVAVTGFVEDFRYSLHNLLKYIFCLIWNLLYENGNLKRIFTKKSYTTPLWGVPYFQTSISKWEFGSYRNGVCRALWAWFTLTGLRG